MNIISAIISVMSFFCIYTSIFHAVIYFRGFKNKINLYFSLLCLCIGIYDILSMFLYLTDNLQTGVNIQIWQSFMLILSSIALLFFSFTILNKKFNIFAKSILSYFIVFFALLLIMNIFNPDLIWNIHKPSYKEIMLFNAIHIKYHEGSPGILMTANMIISYSSIFYIIILLLINFKRNREKRLITVMICLLIYVAGIVNDIAVSYGLYKFIYLIELSFFFIVIAMNFSLTTIIIKQALFEKASIENQVKYQNLFEAVSEAILIISKKTSLIMEANPAACRLFGYSLNEFRNMELSLLFKNIDAFTPRNLIPFLNSNNYRVCVKKNGSLFPAENSYGDIILQNNEIQIIAVRDKTEYLNSQKELQKEKELLSVTLAGIQDGVITTDTEANIILINKTASKLTGYTADQAIGMHINSVFDAVNEKTKRNVSDLIAEIISGTNNKKDFRKYTLVSKNRSMISISINPDVIRDKTNIITGIVLVFHDISAQEKIEKELTKRQKLESLGILAGGIAHDFNNFLTGILGNINLLRLKFSENDKSYNLLLQAEKAALRAKDLTHQLLTFSKGGKPVKKITSIKSIIRDSALFALCGSNVKCDINIPDDLWLLNADPNQIGQVINNLIINANQAMPDGGIIKIEAYNGRISESGGMLPEDSYVTISISDQGYGINENDIEKIFDPFFSTKESGSGLGLTTAYSIVKNHGGNIEVRSDKNKGTVFTIFLPAVCDSAKEEVHAEDQEIIRGKGSILIIDDDRLILNVMCNMLDFLGYNYSMVSNSLDAVVYFKSALNENKPYDAVIIDLTLPDDLSGEEILKELKELKNDIKAIVTSGYSNSPVLSNFKDYGFAGILQKPYKLYELGKTLHDILNG